MNPRNSFAAATILTFLGGACDVGALAQHVPPAQADRPRASSTADSRAKDIAAFRTQFLAKDKSYSAAARAEAAARLAALEREVASVSQAYFDLELARIVALADNGHTHYVLGSILRYYNRAPIRFAVFGEDFHVIRATETNADLLGARLVAIDGHSIEVLREAGRDLWGGEIAFRDRFAFNLLESPELLHALGLATVNSSATYRLETKSGIIERRLDGEPPGNSRPFSPPHQAFLPEKLPLEDANWRTALAPEQAPWSLQDWQQRFRWRVVPELQAVVIELRQNMDAPGQKIGPALRMLEDAIAKEKPVNLVVDMRINDGGDLNTTRDFMQSLPKRVPGRIFVLTSPLTFSAAISSVGYLKQAAPDRVTIVGEPVGDRLVFFAEGRGADLPNNRGFIGLATERHDYADGCRAYKDCHRSVVRHPISVATLKPDIDAPWTIEAYVAGRDPAMEAVAAALR